MDAIFSEITCTLLEDHREVGEDGGVGLMISRPAWVRMSPSQMRGRGRQIDQVAANRSGFQPTPADSIKAGLTSSPPFSRLYSLGWP